MKFQIIFATAFATSLLAAAGPSVAQSATDGGRIATVNGKEIPKLRADILIRQRAAQGQPDSMQMRSAVREELINRELLSAEAERRNVGRNGEIQQQLELARQQILIGGLFSELAKTTQVSDTDIRAEYEKVRTQLGATEYKTRHILVETEAEARDILQKLRSGAKFEDLAKGSKDPGSRENGGDLGWTTPATFVKPFAEAMVALKRGETSTAPVQSQFGFHVIRLEDTRPIAHPPLEQIRPQLQQRVQQQFLEKLVAELRSKSKLQ